GLAGSGLRCHPQVLRGHLRRGLGSLQVTTRSRDASALALARTLRHAWRGGAEPLPAPDGDLGAWTERLVEGGVGALLWWRIRETELSRLPEAAPLQTAFRHHALT